MENIKVISAVLPEELVLDSGIGPCSGDDCNSDSGGCSHDAACGQDC